MQKAQLFNHTQALASLFLFFLGLPNIHLFPFPSQVGQKQKEKEFETFWRGKQFEQQQLVQLKETPQQLILQWLKGSTFKVIPTLKGVLAAHAEWSQLPYEQLGKYVDDQLSSELCVAAAKNYMATISLCQRASNHSWWSKVCFLHVHKLPNSQFQNSIWGCDYPTVSTQTGYQAGRVSEHQLHPQLGLQHKYSLVDVITQTKIN